MPSLIVVCLCADWCNTCLAYKRSFDAVAALRAQDRFEWLDVEDHEDLLGDLDISNFPTLLLLAADGQLLFAGTVTPHEETLLRLCAAAADGSLRPGPLDPAWHGLAQHFR